MKNQYRYSMPLAAAAALAVMATACAPKKSSDAMVERVVPLETRVKSGDATVIPELQRKCDAGDAGICNNLANIYAKGQLAPKDEARALQLFEKACVGNHMGACNNLGWLYEAGQGVAKNLPHAKLLYEKACEGGEMRGCFHLGNFYEKGIEGTANRGKALLNFKKACDAGDVEGCERGKQLAALPADSAPLKKR
jgi:TPR repeat protein